MSSASTGIVFLSAKRTPFGTFNGSLKKHSATDLGVIAAQSAIDASGVKAEDFDHVYFGNVLQTSQDAIYLARHIGLKSGLPKEVPAVTLNRLCGSGFESITAGAREILVGDAKFVLVGGTESMSQAPHVIRGARDGLTFGRPPELEDTLWSCLTDTFTGMPMAITAENLATKYEVSREECDAYAMDSQQRWQQANEGGYFDAEMVPISLKSRKGERTFAVDEHPRADASMKAWANFDQCSKKMVW